MAAFRVVRLALIAALAAAPALSCGGASQPAVTRPALEAVVLAQEAPKPVVRVAKPELEADEPKATTPIDGMQQSSSDAALSDDPTPAAS
jgi:hypothetical protein